MKANLGFAKTWVLFIAPLVTGISVATQLQKRAAGGNFSR
jgi:hypothetical protein